jgi:hypothetical protein
MRICSKGQTYGQQVITQFMLEYSFIYLTGLTVPLVQTFYDFSVQHLNKANFMAVHRIISVQTICVLLQVAHNLDQSDYISVLVSAGIKISQSLGLHRLGRDPVNPQAPEGLTVAEMLISREVSKRVWWFLIRQDWLQIPFQNTYLIHASQFNTPMPLNCYDVPDEMLENGRIMTQPETTFTQTSYSNVMNHGMFLTMFRCLVLTVSSLRYHLEASRPHVFNRLSGK